MVLLLALVALALGFTVVVVGSYVGAKLALLSYFEDEEVRPGTMFRIGDDGR